MRFSTSAAAVAMAIPLVSAQTFTSCDPTKKTCPPNTGLPSSNYNADFTSGSDAAASWSTAEGTTLTYGDNGAVFSIANANQAPTFETDFYIFFGRTDVVFKAATGTGIVSSIVLESDDLDEIDWEFIGGVPGQVQSNYYGKGNTTTYDRVQYHNVADTQNTWHTYSVDWTAERIQFLIDGSVVRTLQYNDALGGQNFPQTPMQLKLGSWAAGASKNEGTAEWAGGAPDFSQGPFNMYVKSVTIQNYNPGCSYEYGDVTGSWESIKVIKSGNDCSASGGSSSSASGSSTGSVPSSATSAPTSSHSVVPVVNTDLPASTTIKGSAYSTNTASISAVNSGSTLVSITTGVASQPSVGINGTIGGTGSGPTPTASSSIPPNTGAAGSLQSSLAAVGSLLSIAAALLLL